MKKYLCLLAVFAMLLALTACPPDIDPVVDPNEKSDDSIMTWTAYNNAAKDAEVVIEGFVQGKQSWWYDSKVESGKATLYLQDGTGGYFVYEMKCTEDEYNSISIGTKLRIKGYKSEWAGEVEIVDATFEIIPGLTFIAKPYDVTQLLGTKNMLNYQNMLGRFYGLEVVGIEYKGGERGDDIYVTLKYKHEEYSFCVESYLTGPDTELYAKVEALKAGDIVSIDGFIYWYEGINTHITDVAVLSHGEPSKSVMTWEEYNAAAIDDEVRIIAYVQGKQSWWYDSKVESGKATLYLQDKDGGYFVYEMKCTEEQYDALVEGAKVYITGYKSEWAGEVEIVDAKFELLPGELYRADAIDVTELLGTDELIRYQNMKVQFNGLEIVSIQYKGGERGDDIYVTVRYNEKDYTFCVESYLTGPDSDFYQKIESHNAGDIVTVWGFLYWYEGVNTHLTGITSYNK